MSNPKIIDRYRFIPRGNGGPVVVDTVKDILYRVSDPLPDELKMFGNWFSLIGKLVLAKSSSKPPPPPPPPPKANTPLPRGVQRMVSNGKYRGRTTVHGVCYTTPCVDTPEEAYSLYLEMVKNHTLGIFDPPKPRSPKA